jgi:hypothetical protein
MVSINELDIVVRRKSGKVVASIPQLGLYGIGPNATSALSALEQKKAALLDDMKAAEVPDEFDRVAWSAGSPTRVDIQRGNLWQFLLKVLVVVVVLSAAMLIPAGLLAKKIQKDLAGFSTGGRQFYCRTLAPLRSSIGPAIFGSAWRNSPYASILQLNAAPVAADRSSQTPDDLRCGSIAANLCDRSVRGKGTKRDGLRRGKGCC